DGIFTLTIQQSGSALSGSYAMQGSLTDGYDIVPTQGTGPLSGSIGAGQNPSINLAYHTPGCPNVTDTFSGTYDSVNRRITMVGDLLVYNASCQVVLTFPVSVILAR